MKKFFLKLSHLAVVFAVALMAACEPTPNTGTDEPGPEPGPEPTPTPELNVQFTASLVQAGSSSAEIKLTTKDVAKYAYVVETKDASLAPEIVFATGINETCKDGDHTVIVESLSPGTSYVVIFAAATVNDEYHSELAKVSLTTTSFTEELTIYDIGYDSFSAHFNYPKDKVQPGNVIKWGLTEFPQYYTNYQGLSDADMINLNDGAYHNYITESTTWVFNERNSYLGDPTVDDTALYSPIVPGQPMYLMLGEFAWDTNNHWGWGDGYYAALFDEHNYWTDFAMTGKQPDQKNYWSGYYRRETVESKAPTKMSAKPTVKMNLTPRGGTITITPTDKIYGMCYAIVEPSIQMQILPLLNNQNKYMQWYITSYHAFMNSISSTAFGEVTIQLDDLFWNGMQQNTQYTLHITSLGDELGSKQSYMTETFTLPKPTKPAPTVTVKGIDNPNGANQWDQVWFNIKCATQDAYNVKYIANYEREWMALYNSYIKAGYTEAEAQDAIISSYGVDFSAEEVALINSAEGLSLSFDSRANATTFLGVRLMNDEGSIVTTVGSSRTIQEPAKSPVNSTLFEDLKGEWTASTTIRYTHYHYRQNPAPGQENNYQETTDEPLSCKVTIGDIGYEKTLPEEVYQLFFASSSLKTKEEVDAVYAQFKTTVDDFNAHTRGQNRILCQGFDLEYDYDLLPCPSPDHKPEIDGTTDAKYASPYDLFIADADTYSAYNYESPVFDFGPKWYLEIAADGTVTAPFNTTYFAPMAQWYTAQFYLVGASDKFSLPYISVANGDKVKYENGHFPVTISADKNTITINPLSHTYTTTNEAGATVTETGLFYPNIARAYNGAYQFYSRVIAPIVLTRNSANATAVQSSATAKSVKTKAQAGEIKSLAKFAVRQAPKSRTALPTTKVVTPMNKVKYQPISVEQFKANCEKFNKERYSRN